MQKKESLATKIAVTLLTMAMFSGITVFGIINTIG